MLYLLAEWLGFEGLLNLVRYQTFRAGATIMTALVIGLVIGPRLSRPVRMRTETGRFRTVAERDSPSSLEEALARLLLRMSQATAAP